MERTVYCNQIYDEERALYGIKHADIKECVFAGEADGESALKEAREINVCACDFELRYPLWHVYDFDLDNSDIGINARAPIWYASKGQINECMIRGIKTLRECKDITITKSSIISNEFGWKCEDILLKDSDIESEYLFLESRKVMLKNVNMKGKYSFQYIEGLTIENSTLDTKDAFWHSKNVVVKDSEIKGEYLGWFSDGLTLINCKIIGTQPLCYCNNLKLVDCTMTGCNLSFEYSDVEANIIGRIDSVKNIRSGIVKADSVGEIITENPVMECTGEVITAI